MDLTQVAATLRIRLDVLAAQVLDLAWGHIPGYEPPRMRAEEYAAAVTPNLRAVVDRLAGLPLDDADTERARQIGVNRALQGVPLDAVVLSYRSAERVITDAFVDAAATLSASQLTAGLRLIAAAFDDLATASIDAYRVTTEEVTAHYDRLAGDLVTGLIAGALRGEQINHLATSLGWDEDVEDVRALALSTQSGADVTDVVALQRAVLAVLGTDRAGRIVSGSAEGCDVLLIPGELTDDLVRRLVVLLDEFAPLAPRLTVGRSVADLASAGASCRQALAAMQTVRRSAASEHVVAYDAVLLDVLATADEEAAAALVDRYLRPLAGRPHLTETVEALARCDLSISRTAEMLYVHPNTVLYRLARVRDLTGADPRRALDLFAFVAAIRANRVLEVMATPS
ncbi:PucR family transcriptional regulator [Egicoccus sp. AB-alg6-2]|uniref:PucR family transcriptional regulator n=1 Tax=Egicoccus sp. AB-alg6-2 TaxID=3242692 RepID=UPI00359E757B